MSNTQTYDTASYQRGWRTSVSGADMALDRADERREVDEWYDGYLDAAASREKWHLRYCGDNTHHNREGGCGRA